MDGCCRRERERHGVKDLLSKGSECVLVRKLNLVPCTIAALLLAGAPPSCVRWLLQQDGDKLLRKLQFVVKLVIICTSCNLVTHINAVV